MFCNHCGHRNTDDSNFCTACGSALEKPDGIPEPDQEYISRQEFEYPQSEREPMANYAREAGEAASSIFGGVFFITYMLVGLVQLAAIMAGLEEWWGVPGILSFIIALFVAYIPFIGQITGMIGAHDAWGWSWIFSIGLFFGPFILIFLISLIGGSGRR